jgi:hypothetical protein
MLMRAPTPLPVREIIAKSYAYAWENRSALILPIAVLLLLDLFSAWLSLKAAATDESVRAHILIPSLVSIWFFLLGTMAFAVGIHRRILLGEARQDLALFQIDRKLLTYLWTMLKVSLALAAICLMLILPIAIFQAVTTTVASQPPSLDNMLPLTMVAIFIDLLFGIRLMLALPGAAVGGERSIRRSWRMSQGNWGRLIFILCGVTLPFQIPALSISQMDPGAISWAAIILNAILTTISLPVLTVALSLSYGKLSEAHQR